jgi:hypothetical protein
VSAAANPPRRLPPALLWAIAAVVVAAELGAASLVLRPNVDPVYRAYYIDQTSDCWPHQTDGDYAPGTELAFSSGQRAMADKVKICGWFYPIDDGTWSHGAYSRLRFRFPPVEGALLLSIDAGAMVDVAHPVQHVAVSVNGTPVDTLVFSAQDASNRLVRIPPELAAASAAGLEVRFDYPDARPGTEMGANEDPRPRALRVERLTLKAED